MKFFLFTPLSNFHLLCWACLYGALNILVPFLLLYSLCSILHNRLPKNVFPNTFSQVLEIPPVITVTSDLSSFSPNYSYLRMEDTQHGCEHDHCSRPLSKRGRFPNYIFGSTNPDIFAGHLLSKHDSDILLPKLYAHLICLLYANSFDNIPYCKTNNFIETKSSRNKLRGLNLF